jgi:actin-related protein
LGSYTIRICIANANDERPTVTSCPNVVIRSSQRKHLGSNSGTLVGPQILEKCKSFGSLSLRQPMDRGMIVDWPTQKMILDVALADALGKDKSNDKSGNKRLLEGRDVIITEAYFNLPDLQAAIDLLFLEEYGAAKIWRCNRKCHASAPSADRGTLSY